MRIRRTGRAFVGVGAFVLAVTLFGDASAGVADWPQAGHDGGRSNSNDREHSLGPSTVDGLRLEWARRIRPSSYLYEALVAPVVVRGGRVFAVWGGAEAVARLVAFAEETGERLWTRRFEEAGPMPVAATGDELIVGIRERWPQVSTAALDVRTGRTRWSRDGRLPFATTGSGGRVVVLDRRGATPRVACLRTATGYTLWSRRLDVRLHGLSELLVAGGRVVAPVKGGRLVALRISDGKTLWARAKAGSPVAAAGGRIYTMRWVGPPSGSAFVEAIDLRDGSRLWIRRLPTQAWVAAVGGGRVFVNRAVCVRGCEGDAFGGHRGGVVALDARTGRRAWRVLGNAWGGGTLWQAGAYANGLLYVYRFELGRARIAALGAWSGRLRWSVSWGRAPIYAHVGVVANGAVLGGTYWGRHGGRVFRFALP